MNILTTFFRYRNNALRASSLTVLICLCLALSACAGKGKNDSAPDARATPSTPNERQLAYGVSLTVPPTWKVGNSISAQQSTKASLDARRKAKERVLIFETARQAPSLDIEAIIALFIVNERETFMPRGFAKSMSLEDYATMSRNTIQSEQAAAKKRKKPSGLRDLQISREFIDGKMVVVHRLLLTAPDGKPVRLTNWDIYLPDGAGLAVKSVLYQESEATENEILNIVRSLRIE